MTKRKTVLVIGMADSIHVARWLKQFVNENIDFFLVPSRKFRNMNWELEALFQSKSIARYTFIAPLKVNFLQGYLDFLKHELLAKIFKRLTRSNNLIKLILFTLSIKKADIAFMNAISIFTENSCVNTLKYFISFVCVR
jgi:hypothetical protein